MARSNHNGRKAKQSATKSSTSMEGRGNRIALRDIANENGVIESSNNSKSNMNKTGRVGEKRHFLDDDGNESPVHRNEINPARATRQRRAAARSKPQDYKEISSDEDDDATAKTTRRANNYSASDRDAFHPTNKRGKSKQQRTKSPESSRFSLPASDSSSEEPMRDWRNTCAIDY